MKLKIIILALVLATSPLVAISESQGYQNLSWSDIRKETEDKIQRAKQEKTDNNTYKLNNRLNQIEKSKRTSFLLKSPKVIDVWVRESYTVLENDYVIKNAPVWKKILLKQKNIWEYQ